MVLICVSLMFSDMEHLLLCLYVILGEMPIQVLCPLFDQVVFFLLILSHMTSLYILDINLLLVILLANILSHSAGCLFLL